jgi:thiamine biosynthesis protein ThiS
LTPEAPRSPLERVLDSGEGHTVALNGQKRRLAPGTTISGLLRELDLPEDRVAVELDGEILKRPKWGVTEPEDGARLEIVHFVGGG